MAGNLKENISLSYYRPLSDEKSAETDSHRDFNERARWRENCGCDGKMTQFLFHGCWLLVSDQTVCSSTSNPYITREIPTITARLAAAPPVILDVHNRTQTLAKEGHAGKRRHTDTLQIHMYIHMHNCTQWCTPFSHTDLKDWQ